MDNIVEKFFINNEVIQDLRKKPNIYFLDHKPEEYWAFFDYETTLEIIKTHNDLITLDFQFCSINFNLLKRLKIEVNVLNFKDDNTNKTYFVFYAEILPEIIALWRLQNE